MYSLYERRGDRKLETIWAALANMLFIPAVFVMGFVVGVVAIVAHLPTQSLGALLQIFARVGGVVLLLTAAFTLRSVLEAEPISIPHGDVMTFFFTDVYFQYNLQDYQPSTGLSGRELLPAIGLAGHPVAPITAGDSAPSAEG